MIFQFLYLAIAFLCCRGSSLPLANFAQVFLTLHHFLKWYGSAVYIRIRPNLWFSLFFSNFWNKIGKLRVFLLENSRKSLIFSSESGIRENFLARGHVKGSLILWDSFLVLFWGPDAPPRLKRLRKVTPCRFRTCMGFKIVKIPKPSSRVHESLLPGNIDRAGARSRLA